MNPAPPGETETIDLVFHKHWIRLVRPVVILLLGFALLSVIASFVLRSPLRDDPPSFRLALLIFAGLFLLLLFIAVIWLSAYALSHVIITDRRIRDTHRTLFLRDNEKSIEIGSLQGIDKVQDGILPTILGYGTLILHAENTVYPIHFIPRVDRVHRELLRLQEKRAPQR
jgi:hypothetical protein